MNDEPFVDSCVVIYNFDLKSPKQPIARELMLRTPFVSSQVVLETVNILMKKLGYSKPDAFEHGRFVLDRSRLFTIDERAMLHGFRISERYNFSHWDSMIVAAAIEAGCSTLYSEDLHHGQVIEGVTIINPFLQIM